MGFARFWRSGRLGRLSIAALAAGVALPVAADIGARAAYAAPNHTFAVPSPGQPSTFAWNGVTLQSPPNGSSASAVPSNASPATCPAPDSGNNAICEDGTLTVPAVSPYRCASASRAIHTCPCVVARLTANAARCAQRTLLASP